MAILPQVDRNELIKHNKCIFVNVPFSDDQQRQLLKCKSETEKAELVRGWREDYANENFIGIVEDVLKLKPETETDKKQVSADALSNPNPPATNAGETQQSLPDRDSTEQAQTSQKIKWKLFGKDRNI